MSLEQFGADPGDPSTPVGAVGSWDRWWSQPKERRRLQAMLGLAIAAFTAMLLAIAFGGPFPRLFGVLLVSLAGYMCFGAFIGSRELRSREAEIEHVLAAAGYEMDQAQPLVGGLGLFEEGFFEPIPELAPQGDGLAEAADQIDLAAELQHVRYGRDAVEATVPQETVTEAGESVDTPAAAAADEEKKAAGNGVQIRADQASKSAKKPEAEPAFAPSPVTRSRRPKRQKARPIYIESDLDEEETPTRAVND